MNVVIDGVEYVPLVKWAVEKAAYKRGEKIQMRYPCGKWAEMSCDLFDSPTAEFRKKPDPIKKWIWASKNPYKDGEWLLSSNNSAGGYLTEERAAQLVYTHKLEFTEIEE